MLDPQLIAAAIAIKPTQVTAVIELLDAGNTIPFIARYRKEMTGDAGRRTTAPGANAAENRLRTSTSAAPPSWPPSTSRAS